jgi:hypothetical protein
MTTSEHKAGEEVDMMEHCPQKAPLAQGHQLAHAWPWALGFTRHLGWEVRLLAHQVYSWEDLS